MPFPRNVGPPSALTGVRHASAFGTGRVLAACVRRSVMFGDATWRARMNPELDPNNFESKLSDPVPRGDEQSSPAKIGLFAIIAAVLIGGLVFIGQNKDSNSTASNSSPGVTTGSGSSGR